MVKEKIKVIMFSAKENCDDEIYYFRLKYDYRFLDPDRFSEIWTLGISGLHFSRFKLTLGLNATWHASISESISVIGLSK